MLHSVTVCYRFTQGNSSGVIYCCFYCFLLHFPSASTRLRMNSNSFNKEFLSAASAVYKETPPFAFIKYSGSQSA